MSKQKAVVAKEQAVLEGRVRRRTLDEARLAVASFLGSAAAKAIVGSQAREDERDLYYWVGQLADHGKEAAVRAAVGLLRFGRDRVRPSVPLKASLTRSIEFAEAWVLCPCRDHVAAARSWQFETSEDLEREDASWIKAAPYIVGLKDSLEANAWISSCHSSLANAATSLAKLTSETRVRAAVRAAVLPWALGETDPLKTGSLPERTREIKKEGANARRRERRKREAKARRPRKTALLGTSGKRLTWDEDSLGWNGKIRVGAVPLDLHVVADDTDPQQALERAWPVVARLVEKEPSLRRGAAARLLDLAREWNEGLPIAKAAFLKKIRLDGATIYSDGTAEVFYEDGDLFAGHAIVVSVDPKGRVDDATIAG